MYLFWPLYDGALCIECKLSDAKDMQLDSNFSLLPLWPSLPGTVLIALHGHDKPCLTIAWEVLRIIELCVSWTFKYLQGTAIVQDFIVRYVGCSHEKAMYSVHKVVWNFNNDAWERPNRNDKAVPSYLFWDRWNYAVCLFKPCWYLLL